MSSTNPKSNKRKSDNVSKYKRINTKTSQMDKREMASNAPLDWAKFTDFRSRNSREDLERLFSGMNASRVKKICETPDESGLCPIHWVAIHNRSDLLKAMIERGSVSLDLPCRNKLFANGTALHLAAMNGSLEVAALILDDHGKQKEDNQKDENNNNKKDSTQSDNKRSSLLKLRDSEGQTALMRSAAPRSKRLNTIWDLLRKNLWSLSGRPSEVALFLICHGADWRETEPTNGMNLMHLAIVNDYDDIVNLLLVIDKDLLGVATANYKELSSKNKEVRTIKTIKQAPEAQEQQTKPKQVSSPEFETINLRDDTSSEGTTTTSSASSASSAASSPANQSPTSEPLLDRQARTERLMSKGLQPLQLAILYGRVAIIGLLWYATFQRGEPLTSPGAAATSHQPAEIQRRAMREHSRSGKELKQILINACWNNKDELARFIKTGLLKVLLAVDLALLALIWAPTYASSADDPNSPVDEDNGQVTARSLRGGLFILSYCISLALAFRVMLKNPGYLRRNSVQYLKEMSSLIALKSTKKTSGTSQPLPVEDGKQQDSKQQSKTPPVKLDLIRTDDNGTSQAEPADGQAQQQQQQQVALAMANELPNWQGQFDELKDKVRLLCHKCRCIRRPRSKHCNYCNHCVQDYDHHCIYLGCCIGRNNRLDFLLTLIGLSITSIYGTLIHSFNSTGWSRFWRSIGLIWILKYAVVGLLSAFLNLKRACQGVTLFESIRSRRIRSIFGPGGPSEAISKSHRAYSILKGSYWRYEPDVYLTGELNLKAILSNLDDFGQSMSCDEYLLTLACSDTSLARALTSSDTRINKYKFVG